MEKKIHAKETKEGIIFISIGQATIEEAWDELEAYLNGDSDGDEQREKHKQQF